MHVRPHLDYCDFIYHIPELQSNQNVENELDDQTEVNECTVQKTGSFLDQNEVKKIKLNFRMHTLESVQYQAALAITGAWKGTSTDKIYKELGWESLHHRRCFRRITQFYKIMNGLTPQYLVDPIPMPRRHLFGRHVTNDLYRFQPRNHRFLHSFYPDAINRWNEIGPELRKIETLSGFKSAIKRIIQPEQKSIFNLHDPNPIRQLRVGLSSLRAHKKQHNFIDTRRM